MPSDVKSSPRTVIVASVSDASDISAAVGLDRRDPPGALQFVEISRFLAGMAHRSLRVVPNFAARTGPTSPTGAPHQAITEDGRHLDATALVNEPGSR